MTNKISKDEAKSPDLMTQELKKGFEWSTKHYNITIALSAVFIVGGILFSGINYYMKQKESELQEKYYTAEKTYLNKKDSFAKYEASVAAIAEAKTTDKKTDKKSKENKPAAPTLQGEKSSGDIQTDYGTVITEFNALIVKDTASQAARLSALNLAEIYERYNKPDEALAALLKVKSSNDVLSALVLSKTGVLQANKSDCKTAVETWGKAVKISKAAFIVSDLKVKMGLCYESLGDSNKAKEQYDYVVKNNKEGGIAKLANKYLKTLNVSNPSTKPEGQKN